MTIETRSYGIDKFYKILPSYEQYDQKNACWNRIGWDEELRKKGVEITGNPDPSLEPLLRDRPGFTDWDHALRRGLSHIDMGYRYLLCSVDGNWKWPIADKKVPVMETSACLAG